MVHETYWARFLCGALLLASSSLDAQTLTATPASPHPTQAVNFSATGFADAEAVDIYLDTTDTELLVSSSTGALGGSVTLPASVPPGTHFLTAVGRRSGDAAQSAITVTTPWVQAGYGAARRVWNPFENTLNDGNANALGAAWSVGSTGSGATAVVSDGNVYVTTTAGISKYAAATGALLWNKTPSEYYFGGAALSNGTLYACGGDGNVYALSASNGATKWSVSVGLGGYSSPVVVNGIVYLGTDSGVVYALKASTGATVWTYTTGATIDASPAVDNGVVYIGSFDDNLYALNAATGALLWKYTTGNAVESSPSVFNGVVYFGSDDEKVYAVRAASSPASNSGGTLLWSYNADGAVFVGLAAAYNKVYVSGAAGSMIALDSRTGAVDWSFATDSFPRAAAIANGLIYFTSNSGAIYALDANYGTVEWQGWSGATYLGGPAVSDGVVYVDVENGPLAAYTLNGDTSAAISHVARPMPSGLHPNMTLKMTH